jgi:ATP-dependent exoDNAse (exonuclease V) beta subunit
LVEAFNEDFSLLFPRSSAGSNSGQIEYLPADAVRRASKAGGLDVQWHVDLLPPADTVLRRQRTKADARTIREIIERWRARPLPDERSEPWKIAVLVRNRNHLLEIMSVLKGENGANAIPYRAVDIELLGERREVLDLFALTRALLHPADRVAWLAVLHAPWCGLGLAELHLLAGADDETWAERCIEDVIAERAHLLEDDSCERLARIWPVLQAAAAQRDRLTISQWVERTWRSLGGDTYLKPEESANARRYLQLLDEIEDQTGAIDLAMLKTRLDKLNAEAASTGEVDLMTIHGAKGLEWDVVIVPGLEKKVRVSGRRLLTWNEIDTGHEAAAHIALAPIVGKGEASRELNDWLNSVEKSREAAERKRLFYVACTRAREELHLFAAPEAKSNGEASLAHGSLLSAAWPAAERHFIVKHDSRNRPQEMPLPPDEAGRPPLPDDTFLGDLAAAAHNHAAVLERLPLSSLGPRFTESQRLSYGDIEPETKTSRFERPEGSFEARAFGNAVHSFLEIVTRQLTGMTSAEEILREVAGWGPRISSVLRSDGLPSTRIERMTERVKTALENTLQDPEGFWILSHRNEAASELALTSWDEARRSVRLDRVFRAGATPGTQGDDYLWIVDYKTTTHGREGVEAFLAGEREKYSAQMETYARMVERAAGKVRLALYYPMIPRLLWWAHETA